MCMLDGDTLVEPCEISESRIEGCVCVPLEKGAGPLVGVFSCEAVVDAPVAGNGGFAGDTTLLSRGVADLRLCGGEYGGGGTVMPSGHIVSTSVYFCSSTAPTDPRGLQLRAGTSADSQKSTPEDCMAHCTRRVQPLAMDLLNCSLDLACTGSIDPAQRDSKGRWRKEASVGSDPRAHVQRWWSRPGASRHHHRERDQTVEDLRLRGVEEEEGDRQWGWIHIDLYQAPVRDV